MSNRNRTTRTPATTTTTHELDTTTTTTTPTQAEVDTTTPATVEVAPVDTPAEPIALVYDKQIGIIGHLRTQLANPQGISKVEMVALLATLFPNRDTLGMAVTVQIQLGRLQKKYGKILSAKVEGRGRVYGWEATFAPVVTPEVAPAEIVAAA